eukprot:scaffold93493_cov54-Attheya_sp.AAC.1
MRACVMPELHKEGMQDWTSWGAMHAGATRLGEISWTMCVRRSSETSSVHITCMKVAWPYPRKRIFWREVGRMYWLSSLRSLIPVVPYLVVDLAMGVVNAVVVVVLGSRVPSPPFECICWARDA